MCDERDGPALPSVAPLNGLINAATSPLLRLPASTCGRRIGRRVRQRRHLHVIRQFIKDKFEVADVTAINAVGLRCIPFVADARFARRALVGWHSLNPDRRILNGEIAPAQDLSRSRSVTVLRYEMIELGLQGPRGQASESRFLRSTVAALLEARRQRAPVVCLDVSRIHSIKYRLKMMNVR